jgi:hypothetical protein
VQPKEPPGCPELTAETILTMSLLTCEAMPANALFSMIKYCTFRATKLRFINLAFDYKL